MIAPNGRENGRPTEVSTPVASERASAPNAETKGNWFRPLGATPLDLSWRVTMLYGPDAFDRLLDDIRAHDGEPLLCPCHAELHPCVDCRAEIDAMLVRRGLKPSAPDYEPRDGEDDQC